MAKQIAASARQPIEPSHRVTARRRCGLAAGGKSGGGTIQAMPLNNRRLPPIRTAEAAAFSAVATRMASASTAAVPMITIRIFTANGDLLQCLDELDAKGRALAHIVAPSTHGANS